MCMPAWQGSPSSVLESMANGVRGMSVSFLIANFLIADLPLWACSAFAARVVASLNSSVDTCKAGPSHVILAEQHPGIISEYITTAKSCLQEEPLHLSLPDDLLVRMTYRHCLALKSPALSRDCLMYRCETASVSCTSPAALRRQGSRCHLLASTSASSHRCLLWL